jgi:ribosomal protein S17E
MGRIKSLMVKKAARQLLNEPVFNAEFENNKKYLRNTMPSKPIRNKIAGYIARLNRMKAKKQAEMLKPAAPAEIILTK